MRNAISVLEEHKDSKRNRKRRFEVNGFVNGVVKLTNFRRQFADREVVAEKVKSCVEEVCWEK